MPVLPLQDLAPVDASAYCSIIGRDEILCMRSADSESDTFCQESYFQTPLSCQAVYQLPAIFQESQKDSFSFCTLAMLRDFHPCLRVAPCMCGESGEMLDFYLYFSLLLAQVIRV